LTNRYGLSGLDAQLYVEGAKLGSNVLDGKHFCRRVEYPTPSV